MICRFDIVLGGISLVLELKIALLNKFVLKKNIESDKRSRTKTQIFHKSLPIGDRLFKLENF